MSHEHSPKKVRMFSNNIKVSLSDLVFGDVDYGLVTENSFIELSEKREINYRKYTELMKKNRIKVKIRKRKINERI